MAVAQRKADFVVISPGTHFADCEINPGPEADRNRQPGRRLPEGGHRRGNENRLRLLLLAWRCHLPETSWPAPGWVRCWEDLLLIRRRTWRGARTWAVAIAVTNGPLNHRLVVGQPQRNCGHLYGIPVFEHLRRVFGSVDCIGHNHKWLANSFWRYPDLVRAVIMRFYCVLTQDRYICIFDRLSNRWSDGSFDNQHFNFPSRVPRASWAPSTKQQQCKRGSYPMS
jgi:hypothetical protein